MRAIPDPRPRSSRRVWRGALRPQSPVSAVWEEAQALRTQSHGQDFLENMTHEPGGNGPPERGELVRWGREQGWSAEQSVQKRQSHQLESLSIVSQCNSLSVWNTMSQALCWVLGTNSSEKIK